MSDPFKATAKQYNGKMQPCRVCDVTPKEGDEIWMQNIGTEQNKKWIISPHEECFKKLQENPELGKKQNTSRPFQSSKFPIDDATKIFNLAESLLESFKNKRGLYVPNTSSPTTVCPKPYFDPLTIEQELQAVESFFKTISGGFKP